MCKVDAAFAGVSHEIIIERGIGVWPAVELAIKDYGMSLIVLGTHGRTGARETPARICHSGNFPAFANAQVLTMRQCIRTSFPSSGGRFP